ncbi:DNA-binding transcriptional LysR family regulator [Pseudonocardia sediminis]|uniref:DNA-binding transcriptional LysR family regulator n=1 Tax=Pseudonocardia sediminis TaxID=1397368 RepID=A0A4Q7UXC4_PSEST|nr:LysR family transcriptional regulator [Pseudonocardia sediminis]RZT85688.1 DNA-binding transcriptional LysR family regulator [Pseudonocardia sediminis]
MEPTITGLRVLRAIAERGTFTAAAAALGYTQPAVSRQVAALERAAGAALIERSAAGARLTPAGQTLLRHARVALDAIAAAGRELSGAEATIEPVRLGVYLSAGAALLPRALSTLRRRHPHIEVITRDGTTPALVRALRAGTLDLAVISSRPPHHPPDTELPRLRLQTLDEGALRVAVADPGPFSGLGALTVADLTDADWIAGPATATEPLLGVWPGLPGHPRVRHHARDWLTKLHLVQAGCGITTVPEALAPALPPGILLLPVEDAGSVEQRRTVLAEPPGPRPAAVAAVARALGGPA